MAHWLTTAEGKDLIRRCRGLNGGLARIGQPTFLSSAERRELFAKACEPSDNKSALVGLSRNGERRGRKFANAERKSVQHQQNSRSRAETQSAANRGSKSRSNKG